MQYGIPDPFLVVDKEKIFLSILVTLPLLKDYPKGARADVIFGYKTICYHRCYFVAFSISDICITTIIFVNPSMDTKISLLKFIHL